MKEPHYVLPPGTKIKTHDELDPAIPGALLVVSRFVEARRPSTRATLHGYVPGHGGDVYWAKHDDGAEAVYCYTEFELDADREPLTHVAIMHEGKVWSLPRPYRHHHVMRVINYLDETGETKTVDGTQGFLDASGRFLTRQQALVSADINGQIKNGKIIGGVLTSEDLW